MLGALGLILPGLLRIKPGWPPLAAAGLVVVMIGAMALTVAADGVAAGVVPLVVGLLAAFVVYGRWRLVRTRGGDGSSLFCLTCEITELARIIQSNAS